MVNREKLFVDVLCNVIIIALVICLATVGLSTDVLQVFSSAQPKAIYNGDRDSNYVSLMFNVYWGEEYLNEILDTLAKYDAKATFFIGGCWVEKQDDSIVRRIIDEGHELANHGYFHKDCKLSDRETVNNEIAVTHKMIKDRFGYEMRLFAPPSGSFDSKTLEIAHGHGYDTIMWSKDTIDWRDKDSQIVYTRATKGVKGGDLILMHPSQHTLDALDRVLKYYEDNNFSATTVSCNIYGKN